MSKIITFEGLEEFLLKLEKASSGEFKSQVGLWLEAMGFEFLDIIQDEIIRLQVVDTRLLLTSFEKGNDKNIWELSKGSLTLHIGTNVEYARYVNDGHWLNPNGVATRFVPGTWSGDKFTYSKGAKTGMLLKQKFIEGKHYWENALFIFEKVFNKSLERNLEHWLKSYFG